MIQPVEIPVKGMAPVPWGENQWKWRKKIADAIREKYGNEPLNLSEQTKFVVEVVFMIRTSRIRQQRSGDIENLAKPVLDTFFLSKNNQSPPDLKVAGVLFHNDDINVFKLTLAKLPVSTEEEEGAYITITWEWRYLSIHVAFKTICDIEKFIVTKSELAYNKHSYNP